MSPRASPASDAAPVWRPHPGPQTDFLSTSARIAIFGGSAGGGKTVSLLLDALRHVDVKGYTAALFRRKSTDLTTPRGLWDESCTMFSDIPGAHSRTSPRHEWRFPRGSAIQFGHLNEVKTVQDWKGSALAMIGFDELCDFTAEQFWYMVSRNRSTCGVRPYIRATCNPDASSWVAKLIEWWIDPETGYPIPERAGKIRYMVRDRTTDEPHWGSSPSWLRREGHDEPPMSVAFFPAKLSDNPTLDMGDPDYRAGLMQMTLVERERLLEGNWKIMPSAGMYFQRSWCQVVDVPPPVTQVVRYWDLAATEQRGTNDPDWSVGVKIGRLMAGGFIVMDVQRFREGPGEVERRIKNIASADGKTCRIGLPQDPGQAGKSQAMYMVVQLPEFTVMTTRESGDKITRFGPFSSQAKVGNIKILRGGWNEAYFAELEGFPEGKHDDQADGSSGALHMMTASAYPGKVIAPFVGTVVRGPNFSNNG